MENEQANQPNPTKPDKAWDIVCPVCFRPLIGAAAWEIEADRYGRAKRQYIGSCLIECGQVARVEQVKCDNRWCMTRYQIFAYEGGYYREHGDWIDYVTDKAENDDALPVLLLGPGGEFDVLITPDTDKAKAAAFFTSMAKKLVLIAEAILGHE
jgi:hypothetical protein